MRTDAQGHDDELNSSLSLEQWDQVQRNARPEFYAQIDLAETTSRANLFALLRLFRKNENVTGLKVPKLLFLKSTKELRSILTWIMYMRRADLDSKKTFK